MQDRANRRIKSKLKSKLLLKWIVKLFYASMIFGLLSGLFLFSINYWVTSKTSAYIFTTIDEIPINQVGLVLGTSKYYRNGNLNQYYQARIDGAANLFFNNKVEYLLLSGDNRQINYNEPITMRKDLISRGIDKNNIILDYAGFRTLDSIVRAKKVFQRESFTIITQRFHCERALFIAMFEGVDAVCLAVEDPYSGPFHFREVLARVAAVIDLYLLGKEPYFLGPVISIPSFQPIKPEDENAVEMPHTRQSLN
ncbi:SanA/YdcF family protein [Thorsellia anophelis]|uniref:SanA protein n=1 Tax=Thorsellia anophelis DSM 18579 TaxID=1123402 RepID=A0A1I0EDI2_9GAMM|nr:ElyC/SanA/YdcF family protein [Thorsellia anophelis]SET43021.1 SanA protein [Thorsellia anophelis DSM 18579]